MPRDSRGRTPQNILFYSCSMCLVGFRLLDSVSKDSATLFVSRKQVAALYVGWSEEPGCCVGGSVSNNETCFPCVEEKIESPVPVAQTLAAMYGWAGVARKDSSHPGHAAIKWRNARWWEFMKSVGAGSRDHSWRHRRETGFAALSMVCRRSWV